MHLLFIVIETRDSAAQRQAFVNAGHVVTSARDAEAALEAVAAFGFDALVLVCAEGSAGIQCLVRALRAAARRIPIIVAVEHHYSGDVTTMIDSGADDLVARARGVATLVARVVALVRRAHGHGRARISIDFVLEIDLALSQCRLAGHIIRTTPMEYRLIEALALRRDTPVQRSRLLELIYGVESDASGKSIDRFVYNIRNKFSGTTPKRYFHTKAGAAMLSAVPPQAVCTCLPS